MDQMTKDSLLYIRHKKYFEKYGYNEMSVERWIKTENMLYVYNIICMTIFLVYYIYN